MPQELLQLATKSSITPGWASKYILILPVHFHARQRSRFPLNRIFHIDPEIV
jgi:hypothetical protein